MHADEPTRKAAIISFSRICAVMAMDRKFSERFKVENEFGNEFEVRGEYSLTPRKCDKCNTIGHNNQDSKEGT